MIIKRASARSFTAATTAFTEQTEKLLKEAKVTCRRYVKPKI
jgi:hypothetical protein